MSSVNGRELNGAAVEQCLSITGSSSVAEQEEGGVFVLGNTLPVVSDQNVTLLHGGKMPRTAFLPVELWRPRCRHRLRIESKKTQQQTWPDLPP